MKWFLDLTMRGKLFVCFGLIFALMAWVIATAHTGIATISESQDRLYQEDFANVRDLLALAMENIKQASVQNVAGTRQAETAAQGLHELGQKLTQLAAQYKV